MSVSSPRELPTWVRSFGVPAVMWALFLVVLVNLVQARLRSGEDYDDAALAEWVDEARVFRLTLPELTRRYVEAAALPASDENALAAQALELKEQLAAMADPTRMYPSQLPLFPTIYRMELDFATGKKPEPAPIVWESDVPRPGQSQHVRMMTHPILGRDDGRATLRIEYQLHAYNKRQRDERIAAARLRWVSALALAATALTFVWVYLVQRRERTRQERRLEAQQQVDRAQRLALENELQRQEAERLRDDARRKLLEQQIATQSAESRALEMKSQLYASIGIMAGSYAHNIKNLLVRPSDLLRRCLEEGHVSTDQNQMLEEVRQTLGTVTQRLQQILQTVRRDPSRPEMTAVDLGALTREIYRNWEAIARDKWKVALSIDAGEKPLQVQGDRSHLQQAVENLLFNARDAIFEMRNRMRDIARQNQVDGAPLREALIQAAGWRGEIELRTGREGPDIFLQVRDNGIGMTEDVREKCLQTHFSTKRDNAMYEGDSTGMGLGLSFVSVVLEHHQAKLDIESRPLEGAVFRVRMKSLETARADAAVK
jgi:signal transduction histidine kinase